RMLSQLGAKNVRKNILIVMQIHRPRVIRSFVKMVLMVNW
ncbi:Os12g0416300, partial [Oryza sativa Japonica Group]